MAIKLATRYITKYYPEWAEKYPKFSRNTDYLTKYSQMRWAVDGTDVLTGPDGCFEKSVEEILVDLFGEALLNFHTFNKIPMHKQQKGVVNHLQILRIAVGFSGKPCKMVAQQPVHALDGVCVCFSSEMFGLGDEIVGMPMV